MDNLKADENPRKVGADSKRSSEESGIKGQFIIINIIYLYAQSCS